MYDAAFPTDNPLFAKLGEARYFRLLAHGATDYIAFEPRSFLERLAKRAAAFWLLPTPWLDLVLVLLAFGAIAATSRLRFFLAAMFGVYPLAFYVTQTAWASSYRHPLEPLIVLCAAESLRLAIDSSPVVVANLKRAHQVVRCQIGFNPGQASDST